MKLLLAALLALPFVANGSVIITRVCTPSPVKPGGTLVCTDTLSGGNTAANGPNGLQWQFTPSQALGNPAVTAGAALTIASKSVSINPNGNGLIIAVGINQTLIADGVLAVVTYSVPITAACPGNAPCLVLNPSNSIGSSTTGTAIPVTINPTGAVSIINPFCDVNGDGAVNDSDVAAEITAVFMGTAADRNLDNKTNVQDVILVSVAAHGGGCLATH